MHFGDLSGDRSYISVTSPKCPWMHFGDFSDDGSDISVSSPKCSTIEINMKYRLQYKVQCALNLESFRYEVGQISNPDNSYSKQAVF